MAKSRITKNEIAEKGVFDNIELSAKTAKAEVLLLETTLKTVVETAKKVKAGISTKDPSNNASIQKRNELLRSSNTLSKSKLAIEDKLQKARFEALKTEKRREQAFDRIEKKRLASIKTSIKQRKAIIDEANAFKNLSKQVNSAQSRFKRLAAQYGETDRRTVKALATFRKLDSQLRSINNTARDGRRDVGRYGLALKNVGVSLKTLLIGGGVVGVLLGVGRAFKDAFNRVREFDKEMQNLSGISGIARDDLKSTERIIKTVAGSSIKTSNEVAKLATVLFALGKSKSEVEKLLEPTNNLSIALGATSEEAGELLVSTLNAFGKGADSGQHFADVIARMRTSTSLDFERIKDSLGFVAATANVLNLSIGKTGALIGVLQDNGVKAARSGRLLNSSFIKLAKEGKTLEGALERINEAQERGAESSEILRIAEKDFGLQSASLGVILANNIEKVAELTNEFDNLSGGSLKELTDTQLVSMDAKLKILDSTWEKVVLTITSGEGKIGNAIKSSIGALTDFLNFVAEGEKTRTSIVNEEGDERAANLINSIAKEAKSEEDRINKLKGVRAEAIRNITKFNSDIGKAQRELFTELESSRNGVDGLERSLEDIQKAFDKDVLGLRSQDDKKIANFVVAVDSLAAANTKVSLSVKDRIKEEKLLAAIELELNMETEENTIELEENSGAKEKNAKKTRELTGLIEKQTKVVSDLNTEIKRATSEDDILSLSLDLDVEKEELERLKRIVSSTLAEIQKIELDLIEDTTEKRIQKEIEKSNRIIKQIETNSRAEESVKKRLLEAENKRLDKFVENEQIKELKNSVKFEEDLAKAEIEQRRTGFASQEEFEEFKSEQFKAIKANGLKAELDLLTFYGREEDKLRIEQLKAQIEGLHEFEKAAEFNHDIIEKAIQFTEDLVVKAFDKRIARAEEEEQAHKSSLDEFKQASRDGNILAKESLAEEQQLAEEAQVKQEKLEQKKQNILLVSAVLSAFNSELASGKDAGQALAGAITSTTVLTQFASALPAFLDGTEDTGSNGKGVDGKGGFHAVLHPNEGVLKKDLNQKKLAAGLTNEEMVNRAVNYEALVEQNRLGGIVNNDTQLIAMANGVDMSGLETRLDSIERAIIDKPENSSELGAITQESFNIVQRRKVGNRTTTNTFKVKN